MSADELPAVREPVRNQAPRAAGPRPHRPGPHRLTLTGISPGGKRLLLADSDGTDFTVDIDPRLRAAVSEGPGRRLETQMDSMLRPRDIQARIRAGETPESVAQAAETTVEKVMPYAAPVLAEREHVAERAQRSSIRRAVGEAPSGARTLGEAVAGRLRSLNIDPETVSWDAWRREDGRWSLVGRFEAGDRSGLGEFTFDQPGNYVTLDNDEARWLVGEEVDAATAELPAVDAGVSGRPHPRRRLSAVPEEQLPLGEDALELVSDTGIGAEQPLEAYLDDRPEREPTTGEPTHEEPPRRAVRKTRGRASVPSWDEIMFGGGKPE